MVLNKFSFPTVHADSQLRKLAVFCSLSLFLLKYLLSLHGMKSNALNNKSNTMKKLFMTVLAVLVMASCGSNDGGNSNGAGGNTVSNNGAGGAGGGTGSGIGDNGGNNGAGGAANAKNVGGNKIADGDDVFGQFFDERIAIKKAFIFEAGQALDANDPAKYVAAYEKYVDEAVNYWEKYDISAMAGNLSDEDLERYNEKYELDGKLYLEVSEIKECAKNDLQFTSWQERKIAKADERMKEAVEKFSDELENRTDVLTPDQVANECQNPGDVLDRLNAEMKLLLEKASESEKTKNVEVFVCAFERFSNEWCLVAKKYNYIMQNMTRDDEVKYADKLSKFEMLEKKIQILMCKMERYNATSDQQDRINNALQKIRNSSSEDERVEVVDNDGGGNGNAVEGIDKIISVTETLLKKAEQATRCNNPEIFVSAFEVYVDEVISIKNKYGDALSKMSPEERQKHAGKIQKMQKLLSKVDNLDDILNPLQPSASQTRRLKNAMKKMQNLD